MEHGQYDNFLLAFPKIDAVQEAPGDSLACIAVKHRELFRVAGDALDE